MTSFADDLRRFAVKVQAQNDAVFLNVVNATKDSITIGSPVTGAPGQPVDTGALRASWQTEFESATSALIATNLEYAPSIEDGVSYAHDGKPMTLRSEVGGFSSVRMTIAGFQRLVEDVARQTIGENG